MTIARLLAILLIVALAARWLRRLWSSLAIAAPSHRMPASWDPHAVLGIGRDAGPDDIARAYREQMKRYHPDRVADLGEELQRLAHEKTLAIQRAYADLARPK